MMRSVYLILNKIEKEIDATISYAYFDLIVVQISPAGAFLRRVFFFFFFFFFYGWGQYKNNNLDVILGQM